MTLPPDLPAEASNPALVPKVVPSRITALARNEDFTRIMWLATLATVFVLAFGFWLYDSGLLSFPEMVAGASRGGPDRYFQDALDYRERRLALAMLLRGFLISFSFIVGLSLCTQGGVFILRQVKAHTAISFGTPPGAGEGAGLPVAASPLLNFTSYSPGVVFLLGGVALMVATQYLSIPIKWIEITPPTVAQLCPVDGGDTWEACVKFNQQAPPPAAEVLDSDPCAQPVPAASCATGKETE